MPVRASGPMPGRDVEAGWVWFEESRTGLVEMASASGLILLEPGERDPLRATTEGTGELVRAAADAGAKRIWLAVGGSATVDGGVGAAQALGWRVLDSEGVDLPSGGGELTRLSSVVRPDGLVLPPVEVLCDVTNPLLGPKGAARVFGPQKGANPGAVGKLEAGLTRLAAVVREDLGVDIGSMPRGGAAGGLAAGAVAFMGASLVSGIDAVMDATGLCGHLRDADWVLTGEGSFDSQSLHGKVVSGVSRLAAEGGVRVGVVAGRVRLPKSQIHQAGIDFALPLAGEQEPDAAVMGEAEVRIRAVARRLAPLMAGTRSGREETE